MAHTKKQDKPCALTKQKHKHMASKTNNWPCAKQDTITWKQIMTNMKVRSQWKNTSYVQQNKTTKKHEDETEPRAEQNKTDMDRGAHSPSELETSRSHSKMKLGAWVSKPRHENQSRAWTRQECRDPNATLQHEAKRRRESVRLEHTQSHAHKKTRQEGSIRALSQNHE